MSSTWVELAVIKTWIYANTYLSGQLLQIPKQLCKKAFHLRIKIDQISNLADAKCLRFWDDTNASLAAVAAAAAQGLERTEPPLLDIPIK